MTVNSTIRSVREWYSTGGSGFLATPRTVEVGDRFYKAAGPQHVWRVARVFRPTEDSPPHAVVVHDDEIQDRTVISIDALADSSIFRRDHGHHNPAG